MPGHTTTKWGVTEDRGVPKGIGIEGGGYARGGVWGTRDRAAKTRSLRGGDCPTPKQGQRGASNMRRAVTHGAPVAPGVCLHYLRAALFTTIVMLSPLGPSPLQISLTEFMRGIRGPMNNRRRKLVEQAYALIDTNGDGEVSLEEIGRLYDVSQHPDVLNGSKFPGVRALVTTALPPRAAKRVELARRTRF